eukprot:27484-Eustigmatos_ZCMA.PRE.1
MLYLWAQHAERGVAESLVSSSSSVLPSWGYCGSKPYPQQYRARRPKLATPLPQAQLSLIII